MNAKRSQNQENIPEIPELTKKVEKNSVNVSNTESTTTKSEKTQKELENNSKIEELKKDIIKQFEDKNYKAKENSIPVEKYDGDLSSFEGFKNYNIDEIITKLENGEKIDLKVGFEIIDDNTYYLLIADNKILAGIGLNSETGQIDSSECHPKLRGKGFTSKLYNTVNNSLYKEIGKTIKSDNLLSPDAVRFWESLVKKGKARVIGRSTIRDTNIYEMIGESEEDK